MIVVSCCTWAKCFAYINLIYSCNDPTKTHSPPLEENLMRKLNL